MHYQHLLMMTTMHVQIVDYHQQMMMQLFLSMNYYLSDMMMDVSLFLFAMRAAADMKQIGSLFNAKLST